MPGTILRTNDTLDLVPAFEEYTSNGRIRHKHRISRGSKGNIWISGSSHTHTPPLRMRYQLSIEGYVEVSQERQTEKATLGGQGEL